MMKNIWWREKMKLNFALILGHDETGDIFEIHREYALINRGVGPVETTFVARTPMVFTIDEVCAMFAEFMRLDREASENEQVSSDLHS